MTRQQRPATHLVRLAPDGDEWTPAVKAVWAEAYTMITAVMRSGAVEIDRGAQELLA